MAAGLKLCLERKKVAGLRAGPIDHVDVVVGRYREQLQSEYLGVVARPERELRAGLQGLIMDLVRVAELEERAEGSACRKRQVVPVEREIHELILRRRESRDVE